MDVLQFAPLAMMFATLLVASPLSTLLSDGLPSEGQAATGVATARKGLDAIELGVEALEQDHDSLACDTDAAPPQGASLATTARLLGCMTETASRGATRAAGLATALNGLFVLGASVPMIVGQSAPEPRAATDSPLSSHPTDP